MSDDVRPLPGDFGVVHMGGDSGKWIHYGQILNGDGFADYEHAFVLTGIGQIVEAEPGGAKLASVHYRTVLWSTGKIPLTGEQRSIIQTTADKLIGTPYSAADYFALAARRLKLGILVPGLRAYVASSHHMICSQLVDYCYQQAGVQLFDDGRWPGYVTPGALAELLAAKYVSNTLGS
jgi:hypothetical protein